MNRIWSSLICASLAMMCFAVNSAPVQAQAYVAAAMNGTPGCCGLSNVPVYGPPVNSGYYSGACCGSSYSGVPIGGYGGCGCGPSAYGCGYGQNNGYRGCGLFGLWNHGCNACGSYTGGSMFPCGAGYPGPSAYGAYGAGGCGYGGCGFRRCGYRGGCNTGCGCAVPVVSASCCAPVANCCTSMYNSSSVITQPATAAPTTTSPMPTYNATPMPATTPAAPTPVADPAPQPEAPKPGV